MNAGATIMVVGCGTMGSGIAQVAAVAGCPVWLYDVVPGAPARARERISAALRKETEKGRLDGVAAEGAAARLIVAESIDAAAGADVVIEAVREQLEIKQQLFRELEAVTPATTLLLTNTSMISITAIADGLRHPERVAGCHFFNPVPRMELVEIIAGAETAPDTTARVRELVLAWGKTPVDAPNTPGFIVNRALLMLLNEAAFLAQEGTAYDDIDIALTLGCNFPMGPLRLMDLIGIDVVLDCQTALWEQYERAPKYEPCGLLRAMVEAKNLGRKTGRGFYNY